MRASRPTRTSRPRRRRARRCTCTCRATTCAIARPSCPRSGPSTSGSASSSSTTGPSACSDWGVWNEANHKSQPTYKSPKRAAQYFVAFRKLCKGCTIVALDVLDQPNFLTYVDSFYRALPRSQRKHASIVGLHNYGDTNYYRSTSTKAVIAAVRKYNKRATFWMTETGGIVNFGKRLKCNTKRAAKAIKYMFKLAKDFRPIKRLYNYNYYGTSCKGFDSGIMTKGGKARRGYYAFKKGARSFAR